MANRSRSSSPSHPSLSKTPPSHPLESDEPSPFPSQAELDLLPLYDFPRPILPDYLTWLFKPYDLKDHYIPLKLLSVLHRLVKGSNERNRYQSVVHLEGWLQSVASWRRERGARKDGWRDPIGEGSVDAEAQAREDLVTLWLSKIGPFWVSRLVALWFLFFPTALCFLDTRSCCHFLFSLLTNTSETDSLSSGCSAHSCRQLDHLPSLLLPTPLETRNITLSTHSLFQTVHPNLLSESLPLIQSSQQNVLGTLFAASSSSSSTFNLDPFSSLHPFTYLPQVLAFLRLLVHSPAEVWIHVGWVSWYHDCQGLKKSAVEQQFLLGEESEEKVCTISLSKLDMKSLAISEPISAELQQMVERIRAEGMIALIRLVRGQHIFFSSSI